MRPDVRNEYADHSDTNIAQELEGVNCPAGLLPPALVLFPAHMGTLFRSPPRSCSASQYAPHRTDLPAALASPAYLLSARNDTGKHAEACH